MTSLKDSKWVEVRVVVPPDAVDAVSGFFFDQGSLGITETEGKDPERGPYVLLQAYFDDEPFRAIAAEFEKELRDALTDAGAGSPRIWVDELPFGDWAEGWKKYFKPRRIGKRVIVAPTWEEYSPQGDDVVVRVDPGMAFGTGQHETTSLCLEALEELVKEKPAARVLDVGTGTGILMIAAVLLGAASAHGTDIDPEAITATRENVENNALSAKVTVDAARPSAVPGTFDIVVANILAEALIALAPEIAPKVAPQGALVLSGILAHLADGVVTAYAKEGLSRCDRRQQGEWVCLVVRRP